MKKVGLYIHIPFCHAKCGYCDFATFSGINDQIPRYLRALEKEVLLSPSVSIETLFIGGGTPTILTPQQIDSLFFALRAHFDFSSLLEATVEANPESASEEVLKAFRNNGINRLSFGLQTTDDALLKRIDRVHTVADFMSSFELARKLGFQNINVDLIYGLPGQRMDAWNSCLSLIRDLSPEHVSAYALKIEKGSKFAATAVDIDDDLEADMYLHAVEVLDNAGYEQYEISNFSRPGYESKHNLRYWKNEDTLGLGLSSASYMDGRRSVNTKKLFEYFKSTDEDKLPIIETQTLEQSAREKESLMLALRLRQGVPFDQIKKLVIPVFQDFIDRKLAVVEDGHYRLTPNGWLLSNQVFQFLI